MGRAAGLDPPSDEWLVGKARDGDPGAYEVLVRRHRDRIRRIAWQMLGDADDADDVTQDVVIQLWTALSTFAGSASFTTWLYRIVVNRCTSRRRGQRQHRSTSDLADYDHPTVLGPERSVVAGAQLEAGLAAIGRLPEELRVPFVLVQLEGLGYRDAAAIMKVSEGAVRNRLHRARTTLVHEMRSWA